MKRASAMIDGYTLRLCFSFHIVWITFCAAVAVIFPFLKKKLGAATRYKLLIVLLGSLWLMPAAVWASPAIHGFFAARRLSANLPELPEAVAMAGTGITKLAGLYADALSKPYTAPGVTVLWLAVGACIGIAAALRHIRFCRCLSRWGKEGKSEYLLLKNEICKGLNIGREISLKVVEGLVTPVLVGLVYPTIYVPAESDGESMYFYIKHELMHYKYRDIWIKLWVLLSVCVFWYDPAVLLLAKRISAECELACDERLLSTEEAPCHYEYGSCLLRLMNRGGPGFADGLTTSMKGSVSLMKERMTSLFTKPRNKRVWLPYVGGLVLVCLLFGIGGVTVSPAEDGPTGAADSSVGSYREEAPDSAPGENGGSINTESALSEPEKDWVWPVKDAVSWDILPLGDDCAALAIYAPEGSAVVSTSRGKVVEAELLDAASGSGTGARGQFVAILCDTGETVVYSHLENITVKVGQTVKAGDEIGTAGSSGLAEAPGCTVELLLDGKYLDPGILVK